MASSYYQRQAPGQWGTNQFQFPPPPQPNFQPQPSWGGADFYRAHGADSDPSLFDHAWSNLRGHPGGVGIGVSTREARQWHRRAYGGMGELEQMLPAEMGHAAAYEAYRQWKHYSSLHEPLSGDVERQREGLIGIAVGEVTRLLQQGGRGIDHYGRVAASDSAAATASIIFSELRESGSNGYDRSRPRSRHQSFSGGYGVPDSHEYDERRSRPRSSSRHRTHSRGPSYGQYPTQQYSNAGGYAPGSIPIPGTNIVVPTAYGGGGVGSYGQAQPGYAQMQSSPVQYQTIPYGSAGVATSSRSRRRSVSPMPMSLSHRSSSPMPMPMQMGIPVSPSYGGGGGGNSHRRHRSASFSMPAYQQPPQQLPYGTAAMNVPMNAGMMPMGGAMGMQPGAPMPVQIMMTPSSSSSKHHGGHKHRKHHHKRSRSTEPPRIPGYSSSARY